MVSSLSMNLPFNFRSSPPIIIAYMTSSTFMEISSGCVVAVCLTRVSVLFNVVSGTCVADGVNDVFSRCGV